MFELSHSWSRSCLMTGLIVVIYSGFITEEKYRTRINSWTVMLTILRADKGLCPLKMLINLYVAQCKSHGKYQGMGRSYWTFSVIVAFCEAQILHFSLQK